MINNRERLFLEIQGIELSPEEGLIHLEESGLDPDAEYNPSSPTSKRGILKTALSMLEALANNPTLMRTYKADDMTITDFATNLQNRIDQLERKIRQMSINDNGDSSFFMLFSK